MKAKRLGDGWYKYRGYEIRRHPNEGFFPNSKYIWEAIDETGCGFAHSGRLRDTKRMIDEDGGLIEDKNETFYRER